MKKSVCLLIVFCLILAPLSLLPDESVEVQAAISYGEPVVVKANKDTFTGSGAYYCPQAKCDGANGGRCTGRCPKRATCTWKAGDMTCGGHNPGSTSGTKSWGNEKNWVDKNMDGAKIKTELENWLAGQDRKTDAALIALTQKISGYITNIGSSTKAFVKTDKTKIDKSKVKYVKGKKNGTVDGKATECKESGHGKWILKQTGTESDWYNSGSPKVTTKTVDGTETENFDDTYITETEVDETKEGEWSRDVSVGGPFDSDDYKCKPSNFSSIGDSEDDFAEPEDTAESHWDTFTRTVTEKAGTIVVTHYRQGYDTYNTKGTLTITKQKQQKNGYKLTPDKEPCKKTPVYTVTSQGYFPGNSGSFKAKRFYSYYIHAYYVPCTVCHAHACYVGASYLSMDNNKAPSGYSTIDKAVAKAQNRLKTIVNTYRSKDTNPASMPTITVTSVVERSYPGAPATGCTIKWSVGKTTKGKDKKKLLKYKHNPGKAGKKPKGKTVATKTRTLTSTELTNVTRTWVGTTWTRNEDVSDTSGVVSDTYTESENVEEEHTISDYGQADNWASWYTCNVCKKTDKQHIEFKQWNRLLIEIDPGDYGDTSSGGDDDEDDSDEGESGELDEGDEAATDADSPGYETSPNNEVSVDGMSSQLKYYFLGYAKSKNDPHTIPSDFILRFEPNISIAGNPPGMGSGPKAPEEAGNMYSGTARTANYDLQASPTTRNNDEGTAKLVAAWYEYQYCLHYTDGKSYFDADTPDKSIHVAKSLASAEFSNHYSGWYWYYSTYPFEAQSYNTWYRHIGFIDRTAQSNDDALMAGTGPWSASSGLSFSTVVEGLKNNPDTVGSYQNAVAAQSTTYSTTYPIGSTFTSLCEDNYGTVECPLVWAPKRYFIHYVGNNARATGATAVKGVYDVDRDNYVWTPINAQCEGEYLYEWNTMPDGSGTTYTLGQQIYKFDDLFKADDEKAGRVKVNIEDTVRSDAHGVRCDANGDYHIYLYGQWKSAPYTVVFRHGDGGTGEDVPVVAYYGEEVPLFNNTPNLHNTKGQNYVKGTDSRTDSSWPLHTGKYDKSDYYVFSKTSDTSDLVPHFTRTGYYVKAWKVTIDGDEFTISNKPGTTPTGSGHSIAADGSVDENSATNGGVSIETLTKYSGDNIVSSAKSVPCFVSAGSGKLSHIKPLMDAYYGATYVYLDAIWEPIQYKVEYRNDTSQYQPNGYTKANPFFTYDFVGDIYDDPDARKYDTNYKVWNHTFKRFNKQPDDEQFKESTFLGWSFTEDDRTLNASFVDETIPGNEANDARDKEYNSFAWHNKTESYVNAKGKAECGFGSGYTDCGLTGYMPRGIGNILYTLDTHYRVPFVGYGSSMSSSNPLASSNIAKALPDETIPLEQMHSVEADYSWHQYYDYVTEYNDSGASIQHWILYAVYDDHPGMATDDAIMPWGYVAGETLVDNCTAHNHTNARDWFLTPSAATISNTYLEEKLLQMNVNTIFDREEPGLFSDFKKYFYINGFKENKIDDYRVMMDSAQLGEPVTFELDFTVEDNGGHKVHQRRALFCSSLYNILVDNYSTNLERYYERITPGSKVEN